MAGLPNILCANGILTDTCHANFSTSEVKQIQYQREY